MKNKKLIISVSLMGILVCILTMFLLFQTHALCFHNWQDATCEEPEMCIICGRTRGEALGHDYTEPTCIEPATCKVCGETDGEPLGHIINGWSIETDATCSEKGLMSGFCTRCKKTIYEPVPTIPHTEGEWTIEKEPVINADATVTPGLKVLPCTVCGETIETKEYTIELTRNQASCLKKAREAIDMHHPGPDYLVEMLVQAYRFDLEDAKFALEYCGADWEEQCVLACQELIGLGESERMIIQMLQYYDFTNEQIENAMQKTGLHD